MENLQPGEGSSSTDASCGSSELLQLNIKTLDSQIYNFHIDKNIKVSEFKEKIAVQCGVPVGQQRLIFRGKVLKDDHFVFEYNMENGDTLHLVERQTQTSHSSNPGEATSNNGNRGAEPGAGGPHSRIGQITHSVVLGTLDVGDSAEAGVPDMSRVIGAVLNSIGIGNLAGGIPPGVQAPQGTVNTGNQGQLGNQSVPLPGLHGQSPLGAAIPIPSLIMPIPDSLNTLMEFINQMEVVLQENGTQQNQSPTAGGNQPTIQLQANSRGLPTIEALSTVIRNAQRLLTDHFVPALSRTVGRLDHEGFSSDHVVRSQVYSESMQIGVTMQHLGALLLELGRTTLTLRMGQSPDDSFVNAGPAVYIAPSGPNPIMVQPFPHQTSSLFSGSAGITPNPVAMGPVGTGGIPRIVNIHIHTGASLAPIISTIGVRTPNGEGEPVNRTDSGGTGQGRGSAVTVPISGTAQPGDGVLRGSDISSVSSIIDRIDGQLRDLIGMQNGNNAPLEGASDQVQHARPGVLLPNATTDDGKAPVGSGPPSNDGDISGLKSSHSDPSTSSKGDSDYRSGTPSKYAESIEGSSSRSSQDASNPDDSSGTPLGLGLGGLQSMKRAKQRKTQDKGSDGTNSSTKNQQARAVGQQVRQSTEGLNHNDIADAMSQMLHNPSIDGLLAGVSRQTGLESPDMLRNMLQQFTQNPAMRNTVNQIAQQVDTHDLEGMFSGMDRGQGGGFDLSRMMQQMMPIVSQALGGISSLPQPNPPPLECVNSQSHARREVDSVDQDAQNINLGPVVQRIANRSPANDIFQSLVGSAIYLTGDDVGENFVNDLDNQCGIVREFMDMLQRDVTRRFQEETGS